MVIKSAVMGRGYKRVYNFVCFIEYLVVQSASGKELYHRSDSFLQIQG